MKTDLLVIYQNIYIFTQETLSPSFILKKNGALHCKRCSKHPLFTTFSLFSKMNEVYNTSSKCWLPNKSASKIFLHNTPYTPPSFKKKLALSITNVFQNIHFLSHFHYFQKWLGFVILQVNANFLINQLAKYFYTRNLTFLLHFKKN